MSERPSSTTAKLLYRPVGLAGSLAGGLIAGAYYRGYLGPTSTIGRWSAQHLRFVVWVEEKGGKKLKSARHILETGFGDAFAPFEQVQVEKENQISEFDLNTTR